MIELGGFTFADLTGGATPVDRLRDVIDFGAHAEEVGLQVFGVGEHHTPRFAIASPAVVLGAIAARTSTIKLTSAVSVLSVLDPVRLHQDFVQLDLVSGGRAEIIAGRSAYAEPFEIFGVPADEYDAVFEEKLDLLLRLGRERTITWEGAYRSPLRGVEIPPRSDRQLTVRVGVGGSVQSVERAARLGLPMTLAALLGRVDQVGPLGELYWATAAKHGHAPERLGISTVGHLFVGETPTAARETFYPYYRAYVADGRGIDVTPSMFEAWSGPEGALMVGSPEEIAEKILRRHQLLRLDRFLGQVDLGGLPRHHVKRSMELLGTEVAAILRRRLSLISKLTVSSPSGTIGS